MAIKLPLFQDSVEITTEERRPTLVFHRWWQNVVSIVETSFNSLEEIVLDIQAAQNAADAAQAAANDAQTAASDAQAAADNVESVTKLSGSGTDGLILSASDAGSDATINISAHTRIYADGSQVAVDSGSLTGLAYSTIYYIYYDDANFLGGAVAYQFTTTKTVAAQTGARHLVGQITTPAALDPDTGGETPAVPGFDKLEP